MCMAPPRWPGRPSRRTSTPARPRTRSPPLVAARGQTRTCSRVDLPAPDGAHDGDELCRSELAFFPTRGMLDRDPSPVDLHQLRVRMSAVVSWAASRRGVTGPSRSGGSAFSHNSSAHLSSQSRSACRCRMAPSIRSRAGASAGSAFACSSVRFALCPNNACAGVHELPSVSESRHRGSGV